MAIAKRYSRNIEALSEQECASLLSKHVAVVGCGGLGGYDIETLARIGVGHLTVIDGDVFEESNLNRQILATEATLGQAKAKAAAERVKCVNPAVQVEYMIEYLDDKNAQRLLTGSDCVVDALDNVGARMVLARACGELRVPIVYGAIGGWFGQVSTVFPGDVGFISLYGSMEDAGEGVQKQMGNLPFTAAATAAFQSAEAVKVLLGRDDLMRNRLLMIDMLDGSCEIMELQ